MVRSRCCLLRRRMRLALAQSAGNIRQPNASAEARTQNLLREAEVEDVRPIVPDPPAAEPHPPSRLQAAAAFNDLVNRALSCLSSCLLPAPLLPPEVVDLDRMYVGHVRETHHGVRSVEGRPAVLTDSAPRRTSYTHVFREGESSFGSEGLDTHESILRYTQAPRP